MTSTFKDSKQNLIVVDGNALLHRAWHSIPPLTDRHGRVVNAVYGFLSILFRAVKDFEPTHLVVAFDRPGKNFRHDAYAEYKATRVKQPDELYTQIPILEEVLHSLDVPVFGAEGFEADDVLGTIAHLTSQSKDVNTYILTGDMDTLQLVTDRTRIITLRKGISDVVVYDADAVRERFDGLSPEQMIDYKSLRGDTSDNIKGVPGIGEVTAIAILKEFGTVENLYEQLKKGNTGNLKKGVIEKLIKSEKDAELAKTLVTIKCDLPLDFSLDHAKLASVPREKVVELFGDLGFKSLLARIPPIMIVGAAQEEKEEIVEKKSASKKQKTAPPALVISEAPEAKQWTEKIEKDITIFVTDEPTVSILSGEQVVFIHGVFATRALKSVLENPKIHKVVHDVKFAKKVLLREGIVLHGVVFDTMLADYLVAPGMRNHDVQTLALTYEKKELHIEDKGQATLLAPSFEERAAHAGEALRVIRDASVVLKKELDERNQSHLLKDIELPLSDVLADMERSGIKIDVAFLQKMSKEIASKLDELTKNIYKEAGEEFNIASPQQLKVVLFEKLRIPTDRIKKTATGSGLSTAASELEKLRDLHPIIEHIFLYREYAKLKSTYIDTLPNLADKDSHRVHTTYNQTIAATGRLSSSDPNLQNIPIRTELGREIRLAFVAEKGNVFIGADYSQVELRLMASLANVKSMIDAFKKGEDIHRRTAAVIWEVPLEEVTQDQRRAAKAINFGIMYGMGSQGLAQGAGIGVSEAREFIQKYFDAHPEIRAYMDNTKELARSQGYVETAFGRRRYLPDIDSGMPQLRAGAERMAINHPIQGTAADLMKIAMIRVHEELKKKIPEARLILTVHDELIIEAPEEKADAVAKILKHEMEAAYHAKVPLVAEVKIGKSWGEMEKE